MHLNDPILFSAAYFYASTFKTADGRGFRLRDENNNGDVIRRYRKEGVTLTLPEGKTLNNIKIFYVWCEEFDVSYCFPSLNFMSSGVVKGELTTAVLCGI